MLKTKIVAFAPFFRILSNASEPSKPNCLATEQSQSVAVPLKTSIMYSIGWLHTLSSFLLFVKSFFRVALQSMWLQTTRLCAQVPPLAATFSISCQIAAIRCVVSKAQRVTICRAMPLVSHLNRHGGRFALFSFSFSLFLKSSSACRLGR